MALGVSTILQYRHFQSYLGQEVLNVQHYIVNAMETLADDLADYAEPIFTYWSDLLRPAQSNALTHIRGEIYEVNGLDFGVYAPPAPIAGVQTGEPVSSFSAVSVQQVRATRATRHGWKRFAGLTESNLTGNTINVATVDTWVGVVADLFTNTQTFDSAEFPATRSITIQPIIWGGNDPAFPMGRYSPIAALVVKNVVTTQNTRKQGRGS